MAPTVNTLNQKTCEFGSFDSNTNPFAAVQMKVVTSIRNKGVAPGAERRCHVSSAVIKVISAEIKRYGEYGFDIITAFSLGIKGF